jgi:hypothetical protein
MWNLTKTYRVGVGALPWGQTDRYDDATSRIYFANAPEKVFKGNKEFCVYTATLLDHAASCSVLRYG